MGAAEVEAFLSHLATDRGVSASTQNQALCALLFLYRRVLEVELDWVENITRAKPSEHVPIVLTRDEVATVLGRMSGRNWLMASLMYGTGMRLTECLRLRIQDVDFGYRQITVFNGKGAKDRVVPLPESLIPSLKEQIAESARVLEAGYDIRTVQDQRRQPTGSTLPRAPCFMPENRMDCVQGAG